MTTQKNIWRFYLLFVATSIIMLCTTLWQRAVDIYDGINSDQAQLVNLLNNALQTLFLTQEKLLGILGQQMLEMGDDVTDGRGEKLLDSILSIQDDLIAIAFADIEGNIIVASSNMNAAEEYYQAIDNEYSRESYKKALQKDQAVLGRTYFIPALNSWIIPVRRRILNADGELVALISAVYRLGNDSYFFGGNIHIGKHHRIVILRDNDWYVQYMSADNIQPDIIYGYDSGPQPLSKILEEFPTTIEKARDSVQPLPYTSIVNHQGFKSRGMLIYNDRYDLWVMSEINNNHLMRTWFILALSYFFIFLLSQIGAYFLYRKLSNISRERENDLYYQAMHDSLTSLPNRNFLFDKIQRWIGSGKKFALLFIDMDNFKGINDGFGHESGDKVLQQIGQRLLISAGKYDVVVRVGGDEFVILTPMHKVKTIEPLASRVSAIVDDDFIVNNYRFTLGVSIGVAYFPEHANDLDGLMRASDIAMYEAKKYKNSVRYFDPKMQQNYLMRISIEQKIRNALIENELFLVYQPKVNHNGDLLGVESLIRWNNPDLGHVSPENFIPIAESTGLINPIGQFVISTALREIYQVQKATGLKFSVAINISVSQFFQENFFKELIAFIDLSGIDRHQIYLEITESLFIDDMDLITGVLRDIHAEGIKISMDDFGTGYSSLSSLSNLPIDELKIDKSFVDHILDDRCAQKMIQSIIAIGKNLDMTLIAEGVESVEQVNMLYRYGCERYQGYYFSKPLLKNELQSFILERFKA